MQAYQITEFGGAASLRDCAPPTPGQGEVRVRIAACALNFADLLMIEGRYQERPPLPVTLGMELAGRIDATGPDTGDWRVGDRVAVYSGQGGLAEFGTFAASRCIRIPEGLSTETAAALQIAHGTGHLALVRRARLCAGETLLVLGAAGGVGLAAVEIGKLLGARVIAVARGADRLQSAAEAGADHLIDSTTPDLRAAILGLGGADVVYDAVGGEQFAQAFRATRPEGRILCIGFASGDVPQIKANHLLVKNIEVIGVNFGGYLKFDPAALRASIAQVFDWAVTGRITPRISHRFPFARTAEALELLRARGATGKIVVTLPNPEG